MPMLEAPINFDDESSPDNSTAADLAVGNAIPVTAQLRIHTPDTNRAPIVRGGNTFGGVRLPTIRLHTQRTLAQAQAQAADTAPTTVAATTTAVIRPIRGGTIFAELEAEANITLNWHGVGPPPPPPVVNLLPVTLPPQVAEPQLDELLRRVTNRNDLQNVETVRLRVISAITVSLSRLAMFLPRLQHLDLSGSVLCSLRDLGCGLLNLSHLNVSNCGLNSFDGTSGMPSVRTLIADGNMIQRVGPLAQLPLLQNLSAQNNRISDLSLLTFLAMCPNLAEVELQGNPVCHLRLYRHTLQRNVRSLRRIDGLPVDENESADGNDVDVASTSINSNDEQHEREQAIFVANFNRRNALLCRTISITSTHSSSSSSSIPNTASDNDALSSLSSEYQAAEGEICNPVIPLEATRTGQHTMDSDLSGSFSSANSDIAANLSNSLFSLAPIRQLRRPATAPTINTSDYELETISNRPASTSVLQHVQQPVLDVGAAASSIVAGSILDLVRRQNRRHRRSNQRTAWLSNSNGSISSASSITSTSSLEPVVEIEPSINR